MDNGFPDFPIKGEYVRFEKDWGFINSQLTYASTQVSATISSNNMVPVGTIGRVLDIHIPEGYDHDVSGGYLLYIGVIINGRPVVLKFPWSDRPDVIQTIPDTPAAKVLYGKKNG